MIEYNLFGVKNLEYWSTEPSLSRYPKNAGGRVPAENEKVDSHRAGCRECMSRSRHSYTTAVDAAAAAAAADADDAEITLSDQSS